jgi:hypothetical protein
MLTRVLHPTAVGFIMMLVLSCATPSGGQRAADTSAPTANGEPLPPPSNKKGVILPTDVKLDPAPAPAVGDTGTAGPAIGPTAGTASPPN